MEELFELRLLIEQARYTEALALVGEMEEMRREDEANKIGGLLQIVLLHLIKQQAEKRSTRSWEISIRNTVRQINRVNKRRKAGGYYLTLDELGGAIDEVYDDALGLASLEAFEGRYDPPELGEMVDKAEVKEQALRLILEAQ